MTGFIKCPLNYVGGKTKLLGKILPLFPNKINTFIDLFGGGFNVGINVPANKWLYNDAMTQVSSLLETFYVEESFEKMDEFIEAIIEEYNLSKENREGYLKLREEYNESSLKDPLILFTLICYSFNNQIRFNKKGGYNMPFGKDRSRYTTNMKNNLEKFSNRLKEMDIDFLSDDFKTVLKDFDFQQNDFVYADPPYLISTASYNETSNNGGWSLQDEKELLSELDNLDSIGVKWALSNVLENNGNRNELLIEWSEKYDVTHLSHSYSNCNYQRKDKTGKSDEVLIRNFS